MDRNAGEGGKIAQKDPKFIGVKLSEYSKTNLRVDSVITLGGEKDRMD